MKTAKGEWEVGVWCRIYNIFDGSREGVCPFTVYSNECFHMK